QRDGLRVSGQRAGRGDHFDRSEMFGRPGPVARRRTTAEQGLHPGQELEHAERLRDVIVRAEAQAAHLVGLLAAGREDEDRHAASFVPQRPEHPVAVEARKHQVENDEIGRRVAGTGEPLRAVLDDEYLVALNLEVVAEAEREIGVVFHDENARHAGAPASAWSGPVSVAAWPSGSRGSSMTKR